jgi:hypothetical protein
VADPGRHRRRRDVSDRRRRGFAWPYWDTCAGPPVGVDQHSDRLLYQGEVCIRTFTANEVGWEPGVRFENSRYYLIIQARPVDEVLAMPECTSRRWSLTAPTVS